MSNFRYVMDDSHVELVARGDMGDLLAHVCSMVHTIYERLPNDDAKKQFKEQLMWAFQKGLPFKPIGELEKRASELLECVKDFLNGLEEKEEEGEDSDAEV